MSAYTPTTAEVRLNTVMRGGLSFEVSFAEFDRWLAEVERAAAERGWDEGYEHNCDLSAGPVDKSYSNPYRKTKEEHDD